MRTSAHCPRGASRQLHAPSLFTEHVAADSAQDEEDYVVYERNMREPGEKRVRYRMTNTVV